MIWVIANFSSFQDVPSAEDVMGYTAGEFTATSAWHYHSLQQSQLGTFKKTMPGGLDEDVLGCGHTDVVLKQAFYREGDTIGIYDGHRQARELLKEVQSIIFAKILLDMVYNWVQKFLTAHKLTLGDLPSHIPLIRMRFVKMTLAIEQNEDQLIYLVEEKISDDFEKYINNATPAPLPTTSPDRSVRAQFLAFTQHVQFWKMKKIMFVSDYQGMGTGSVTSTTCLLAFRWLDSLDRSANNLRPVSNLPSFALICCMHTQIYGEV